MTADEIIAFLNLEPLEQEGGWFQRSYTSGFNIGGDSPMGTAIYYLLKKGEKSALHRIFCDEIFHFYGGDPVDMYQIDPVTAEGQWITLGSELDNFQFPQYIVQAGVWQGIKTREDGVHGYSLLGCTVVPGFDWEKFELGKKESLLEEYPDLEEEIAQLVK
jgi:predicted cupin superfamily sugar epimerase